MSFEHGKVRNASVFFQYFMIVHCRTVLKCALHWESNAKNKFNFSSAVIRSIDLLVFFCGVCELNQTSLGQNANDVTYVGDEMQTSIRANRVRDLTQPVMFIRQKLLKH